MQARNRWILASLILCAAGASQGAENQVFTPLVGKAREQSLQAQRAAAALNLYSKNAGNDAVNGRETLEEIHARGLARNAQNLARVRALLASTVSSAEKSILVKILGQLYANDNPTGGNQDIVTDLRMAINAQDPALAQVAVLTYSRLAYFPDFVSVLRSARDRRLIGDDVYYGEIAHIVYFAPAEAQPELLSIVRQARNTYATQILSYLSHDPGALRKLTSASKRVLLAMFEESEPAMPQALGELGIEADIYAMWLHALATLKSDLTNDRYDAIVLAHLNHANTDPRKIMGYLASNDGAALMRRVGSRAPFAQALERIDLYARQLPQSRRMRDMVHEVAQTLAVL